MKYGTNRRGGRQKRFLRGELSVQVAIKIPVNYMVEKYLVNFIRVF